MAGKENMSACFHLISKSPDQTKFNNLALQLLVIQSIVISLHNYFITTFCLKCHNNHFLRLFFFFYFKFIQITTWFFLTEDDRPIEITAKDDLANTCKRTLTRDDSKLNNSKRGTESLSTCVFKPNHLEMGKFSH